jgi:hypothetical protein
MIEAQFDKSKVPDKATRRVIETAADTLFPDLLPEVAPKAAKTAAPEPMAGEVPLFDEDLLS